MNCDSGGGPGLCRCRLRHGGGPRGQAVRAGRGLPARPAALGGPRARIHHDRSGHRPAPQGQHADRDDAGARPGGHHPGQRDRAGRRGRLLQGRRRRPTRSSRVEDYRFAVSQMAQTSLRSIIGKSDLDDLLSNREKLNQGLELMIDSPAVGWGVHHRPGRDQGRLAAGDDEAVDGPPGGGRPRAAGPGHQRGRRAPGVEEARRGRRGRCPSSPPRSSCGCCRPWWRSPPRRTPRWSCPSRWSCCASWSGATGPGGGPERAVAAPAAGAPGSPPGRRGGRPPPDWRPPEAEDLPRGDVRPVPDAVGCRESGAWYRSVNRSVEPEHAVER